MRDISREYPVFRTDLVYLDPNEVFHFSIHTTKNCIAGFVFQGNTTRTQEGVPITPCPGGFFKNPPEYSLKSMDSTAGDDGASWLCVSYIVEGQYEAQPVNVAGDYTLPAGWGFAVAQGEVTADGKTATQGLYFAPRSVDVVVSGNADLIILR